MLKGFFYGLTCRLLLFTVATVAVTWCVINQLGWWLILSGCIWLYACRLIYLLYRQNARKIAFMFDAIDNSDYAFQYATRGRSLSDKLVSESLNRITRILFQAKAEAVQKENIMS